VVNRSIFFVPGNKENMMLKSLDVKADVIVWDLEGAVPIPEKDKARQTIGKLLELLPNNNKPIYVRINSLKDNMFNSDLEAIIHPNLHGVMLAKTETSLEVSQIDYRLSDLEISKGIQPGKIRVYCVLETCLGIINAYQIASYSPRVKGISFGADNYTLDLGIKRSQNGRELLHVRDTIALAAGASKVLAIDTIYPDINNEEGLINECRLAKKLGFHGKLAIHPKQVEVINREFLPSIEEMLFAQKVVEAFSKAQAQNIDVVTVDGKTVDLLVLERSKQIIKFKSDSSGGLRNK